MPLSDLFKESWETIYQATVVKLPRAVPTAALRYTSPEGPHPFILDIPSRDFGVHDARRSSKRTIPVYVFIPPLANLADALPSQPDPTQPKRLELPVMLDFHGGGFFMGSCLEQAPFCALMARSLNCIVISVDYRMAPIDKFPAAVHDTEDVLQCLMDPAASASVGLDKAIAMRCAETFRKVARRSRSSSQTSGRASRASSRATIRENSPVTDTESLADLKVADSATGRLEKKKEKKEKKQQKKAARSREGSPRKLAKSRSVSPTKPAPIVTIDRTRIAISGFSSGGNLALNAITNVPAGTPGCDKAWPCPIPADYPYKIPTLLYYPAVDLQQLPSERLLPKGMQKSDGFFARLSDNLAPSYCPRDKTSNWRASPGLADSARDIHPSARMMLVLPELDNLADQNEQWATKVAGEGRGDDLQVERYTRMTHGWTQFPVSFLSEDQKQTRNDAFDKTIDFVKRGWFDGEREKRAVPP